MAHEQSTDVSQEALVKVGTMLASIAAGWLTQHLVGAIWKAATGKPAPRHKNDDDLKLAQAVAFAAVSAGAAVLVNRVLNKGVRHLAEGLGHAEPPTLEA